jgi:two-component system, sensor histidine kinase
VTSVAGLAKGSDDPDAFVSRRRYEREQRAREEAERLLEQKSRSLYDANQRLVRQAETLEAEVRRRTADLDAARRAADDANRAKSEFLAVMSHEIRTPMNGVFGAAEALAQTDLTVEQREMLALVIDSGRLMLGVIDEILDLSKIEAGKLVLAEEPCDLAAALTRSADLFRVPAEARGLTFSVRIDPRLSQPVLTDPTRLGQIVNNLLSNAVKFTEAGDIRLSALCDGAEAVVSVADSGIGIPAEVQAKLFRPFAQADDAARRGIKGTGLGLSISRRLAELMGGTLTVGSRPEGGTVFTLRLPLRAAEPRARAAEPAAPAPGASLAALRPRLLAVDDNATNRLVLKHILARQPVSLTLASGAEEALALCERAEFDLVLMDIQMPGMDGVAALAELRRREANTGRPPVPVVAVSANVMVDQVANYLATGFAGHVAKPVGLDTLVAAILGALAPDAG